MSEPASDSVGSGGQTLDAAPAAVEKGLTGHLILKADRGLDLYLVWSTGNDNAVFSGTRAELEGLLRLEEEKRAAERLAEVLAELEFVDENGSSADLRDGGWESPGLVVMNLPPPLDPKAAGRWLPRGNLAAYAEVDWRSDADAVEALTRPFGPYGSPG